MRLLISQVLHFYFEEHMKRKKIRIAHLITNFAVGGAQDYLFQIVRGLDKSRFEPIVAGRMEGEWVSTLKSLEGVSSFNIPSLRRSISPYHDLRALFEIKTFCEEQNIDILHTHSSKPGVVARLGGYLASVPAIVHTIHGFSFNDFMPAWQRVMYIQIERFMSRFTTTLLLYSNADHATARKLGISATRSLEMFYYGIDFAPLEPVADRKAVRENLGFSEDHRVIGFTGRFSEQKGLHILIRAFAQVQRLFPQSRLLLVGDGPLRRQIEEEINAHGLQDMVVITGFRSQISLLLSTMDVFVMTSFWEGLSRSLAEAMYAKLPVVATNVGGTADAIRNGETGWLIPPNDVNAAVRALTEALTSPEQSRELAENGYRWARQAFDPNTMNQRITRLYEDLVSEHPR
jgi:glycosyltransferase involved in cell wall biosynthesis